MIGTVRRIRSWRTAGMALLLAAAATAGGDVVVQTWGAGKHASHPQALKIADAGNGAAVIEVDLTALPKGAKVRRARLFMKRAHVTVAPPKRGEEPKPVPDDALIACEVFAGARAAGKPLEIVGPRFDHLDATAAVSASAGGTCRLHVKPLPDWARNATRLEVTYEGDPPKLDAQARGLKALHRAGQTFITFKEIEDLAGKDDLTWKRYKELIASAEGKRRVRYGIYRGAKPITAATLAEAERIAVVEPLSGWNLNGRNSERPIDLALANQYAHMHGHWNPFADARVDGKWGENCPLDRFVIEDGTDPLPRDAGLYVHTATDKAKAYYAVVVSIDGTENTREFGPGNSLQRPLDEAPGECRPVLQRELPPLPFWNYPEKRLHYVRWVAPPHGPRPCQYYNWSVAVPDRLGKAVPMELHLHRDDRSYWRTGLRVERDSIVVSPYDYPLATWWHGHHEAIGTLKSFRQGVIQPYTERRVLWFCDWVQARWPVDRERVLITGVRRSSGGAGRSSGNSGHASNGAARLALRYPKRFNLALVGYNLLPDYRIAPPTNLLRVWGDPQWEIKTAGPDPADKTARNVWDELDLVRIVKDLPAATEVPLMTMSTRVRGPTAGDLIRFTNAMLDKHFPIMFQLNYWPGPKLIPISASGTWPGPMLRMDLRRGRPLPAFATMTLRKEKGYLQRIPEALTATSGDVNMHLRWGGNVVDRADRLEMTLWAAGRWGRGGVTTDATIRRARKLSVAPGRSFAWEFGAGDNKQSGEVTVGADGLLVIPKLKIVGEPTKLVVTPK